MSTHGDSPCGAITDCTFDPPTVDPVISAILQDHSAKCAKAWVIVVSRLDAAPRGYRWIPDIKFQDKGDRYVAEVSAKLESLPWILRVV